MSFIRSIRTALLSAAALATVATAALATPKQDIAEKRQEAVAAQARIQELGDQLEPAIERYDQAQAELANVQARIADNKRRIGVVQQNIAVSQQLLSARLVAAYRAGDSDVVTAILSAGSVDGMFQAAAYMRRSQKELADLLTQLAAGKRDLEARKRQLARDEARQVELTAQAKAEKEQIQSSLAEQQQLYAGLKDQIAQLQREEAARQERLAEEARRRLEAERAAAAAAAARTPAPDIGGSADSADSSGDGRSSSGGGGGGGGSSDGGGDRTSGGGGDVPPPPPTDGSIGARAVAVAMRYLGVPYVWGGSSPSGFDCSGLTMYAYAAVGINLDHYTGSQWNEGTHIGSQSDLLPGDLVFFGSDLHHVGMYIGGGQFIHAPHTGDVVKISDLGSRGDYAGGVRPY